MTENTEVAILAGGCCWITQELMRHSEGLISIRTGWTGGESDDPTEDEPGGHAEAVELVFDASRTSFRDVLELFFQIHRPDLDESVLGSIYRSEIFYTTDEQREVAEDMIAHVEASGFWPQVATKISEAGPFIEAEAEDQDYFQRYPASSQFPQSRLEAAKREAVA
ncbi:MAG: peptide-methionine (S)-S-oxide reductase [Solirubrobacterales bacterium]|jgi:peptide-methionine (S)-S-oxide reductase|nr:peptide-methionine (S)-S-oxide reductase [Solirubrobacterales bacterium]